MRANINTDPVGFVLDSMWSDLTRDGTRDAVFEIRSLLATRMYPEALCLAIAVECDRAKRDAIEAMYREGNTVAVTRMELLAGVIRNLSKLSAADFKSSPPPPKRQEPANGVPNAERSDPG